MNYSNEEKEAIEYFKSNLEMTKEMGKRWGFEEEIKNNETVLNLIQKQDKIIKHLAAECSICSGRYEYMEIKEIIEHFEKKVVDEDVKD